MKVFNGKNGRVVVEYDSLEKAGLHPDTKLERINELSDGYHTFDELYEFRKMYNAVLFNEWANTPKTNKQSLTGTVTNEYGVHKSWRHNDGELCFGGGWFIVSAMLPTGLISNHYKAEDWDSFQIPEVEKALYEFDGHTSEDVLNRLKKL